MPQGRGERQAYVRKDVRRTGRSTTSASSREGPLSQLELGGEEKEEDGVRGMKEGAR